MVADSGFLGFVVGFLTTFFGVVLLWLGIRPESDKG